jgi:hypothetical protein
VNLPTSQDAAYGKPLPAVRLIKLVHDGAVIRRVPIGAADQLIARGWAEWCGHGSRRHLTLTAEAPLSSIRSSFVGDGTRAVRGDGTTRTYGAGQLMGDSRSHREFRPVG